MFFLPFIDRFLGRVLNHTNVEDLVDRLNNTYTAGILIFFALMVSGRQFVGSPIQCIMPMEFKYGWEQYAEEYCFSQNTYHIPMDKEIPGSKDAREEAEIGYYQWTPIFLAIQAFFFYLPNWFWLNLNKQSGLDLVTILGESTKIRSLQKTERSKIKEFAEFISDQISTNYDHGHRVLNRKTGCYTSLLYIFVKFFYLANVLSQFFLMNHFLGANYTFWGLQTLVDLYNGHEWMDSGVFPRITLCDFTLRKMANLNRYTVQCVLIINMFNEKIYMCLWFWFLFVAISTLINTLNLLFRLCFFSSRQSFVKRLIMSEYKDGNKHKSKMRRFLAAFVQHGLQTDGILTLYFIEGHAGGIVAKEVATALFNLFVEKDSADNAFKTLDDAIKNFDDTIKTSHDSAKNSEDTTKTSADVNAVSEHKIEGSGNDLSLSEYPTVEMV